MSGFSDYTTLLPRKEDGDGGGVGGGSLFFSRNTKPFFLLLLFILPGNLCCSLGGENYKVKCIQLMDIFSHFQGNFILKIPAIIKEPDCQPSLDFNC